MDVLSIIIGGALILVAVGFVVAAFAQETVVFFGAAILAGAGAFLLVDKGWHGEDVKWQTKHQAILQDLNAQGIHVTSSNVSARGGTYLVGGTEADLNVGKCLIPFIARKLNGEWRLVFLRHDGSGVVTVDARRLSLLAKACT